MSDKNDHIKDLSRRHFLRNSAVTGVAGASLAGGFGAGALVRSRPAEAATNNEHHVEPGELDEYYGFWSGGHSGEVRILGVPSMRELLRIPVFNVDSATGWGITNESKRVLGPNAPLNGDTHHPKVSYTDARYDGRWCFINDKLNTRVARIRLDIMRADKILTIPNVQSIHGLTLQRVPSTERVFAAGEMIVPLNNNGEYLDDPSEYWTMMTCIDAETMEFKWQAIVDGNLDNCDTDYTGRFVAASCYNSARGMTLPEMMGPERDWTVIFDVPAIEAAVAAGNYTTIGDSPVPVVDAREQAHEGRNAFALYVPTPRSPHGVNTAPPEGKYCVVSGKLSPTCTVIEWSRVAEWFDGGLSDPRDVVVAEPEVGLGPLHTTYDDRGNAYTSLFLDSQVVKWNIEDAIRAYNGEEVNYIRDRIDVHYNIGHLKASLACSRDVDGKYLTALCKFSKDRFLPVGPMHAENDQLIDITGEQMKLVHDGPTYAEPHDALMIRADQLNPSQVYTRDDPYFAETVAMARADGVTLETDNKVIRDGNKVRVYMTSVAPSFGTTEFRVKQGDEVTIVVTNMDTIEDVSHGFALVNHGINFEIHPQQTSSVTFVADKPGVHWYYCSWFCHALHMEMSGRMLVEPA
ncbi:nitrous-oxide reductase [Halomonas daqingensis]|uniref:TAT-dependent nitrous-oxide reductase n=1 Tax=Billgrantia desiderata TaxID=52021 RepID=UPI001F40291B|nr:TAT-dependent nitrous-oxide reductase [Halomonas desiderata]MCE8010408.1 nitrous-oxide reductase [Halomonas desiderata]MCE8030518.1 nitrous-oxide reductase [Halomonas desiderata]